MEYRVGKIERVFCARFDDGEDFLTGLREIVVREQIRNAWFHVLGGVREAAVVTGPKRPVVPPEPVWAEVKGAREVLGLGSIFWDDAEPKIHLHAAMGHHGDSLIACVRKNSKVYLVLEAYIVEISGFMAARPWNEAQGFNRLIFA